MARGEFKGVLVLLWSSLWYLVRARFGDAAAHLRCALLRVGENLAAPFGKGAVSCGFCGWTGPRFHSIASGNEIRRGALCPGCSSLERHREFLRLFEGIRQGFPGRIRLLDVAPNPAFQDYCRADPDIDYLSIDLVSPLAMEHMDLQDLRLPDAGFDVVYCCHVLDYVPDDGKALREIHRVLRPGGTALLQESWLRPGPTEEWGRHREDQLGRHRQYGADFPGRLRAAGFRLEFPDGGSEGRPAGEVVIARKPADAPGNGGAGP